MSHNLDDLKNWIGKTETVRDFISPTTIAGMSATLDRDDTEPVFGTPIPASWHWLFFNKAARQSQLGIDGHPARGGFLPPVPLPRRMWAGSKVRLLAPLKVGTNISRLSTINNITIKEGKTGPLLFFEIDHQITGEDGLSITDLQTVVYRDMPAEPPTQTTAASASGGKPAPDDAQWSETVTPTTVLLFRYSALTFIGHRIHYDRDYTVNEEGYQALLVHGPLTASFLMDLCRRNLPDREITKFQVRAVGPLFDNAPFTVHGKLNNDNTKVELWAANQAGNLAMSISAQT